jgi:hypothetical protein
MSHFVRTYDVTGQRVGTTSSFADTQPHYRLPGTCGLLPLSMCDSP